MLPTINFLVQRQSTFLNRNVLSGMLLLFCARIKPFGPVVPLFGNLTRELSTVSGLGGEVDPDIGLVDRRMDRPVKPLLFKFYR
jgi:hypothetical protein